MMGQFSIQGVELKRYAMRHGSSVRIRAHAYLCLVDETSENQPKIVQELHFYNYGYLGPRIKNQTRPLDVLDSFRYLEGGEEKMWSLWHKALLAANAIKLIEEPFLEDELNCQSAVRTLCDVLDVDFEIAAKKHEIAGGHTSLYNRVSCYMPDLTHADLSVEEIREISKDMRLNFEASECEYTPG